MNPYEVMMLEPGTFTLQQLQSNYKRLASQLTPGTCKLSRAEADEVMDMLYSCYKALLNDYSARAARSRSPSDVSAATASTASSSSASTRAVPTAVKEKSARSVAADGDRAREMAQKMDMARFNQVFDENRTPTVYDKGYAHWLKEQGDKEDGDDAPKTCDVVQIAEPEPVSFMRSRNMGFTELGLDDVDNFGRVNEHGPRNSIKYCDLRVAHSARNNLINAKMLAEFKEQNRSLEEIKQQRESAESMKMTPEQLKAYEENKRIRVLRERQRERALEQFDNTSAKQFNRAHASMFQSA